MAEAAMRLDRFLWFARIVRKREAAQALAEAGHLRIDGRAVARAHCPVRTGNVLTFAQGTRVRVLRVEALPARRGSPAEAQGCYTDLTAPAFPASAPPASAPPAPDFPAPAFPANVSQQRRAD